MENQYKRTTTTVSFINYHFVFCPRFRRKIFDIPGVEERFKELVSFICEKNAIEILAMECHHDHAHLLLSCLPAQSSSASLRRAILPQAGHPRSNWKPCLAIVSNGCTTRFRRCHHASLSDVNLMISKN